MYALFDTRKTSGENNIRKLPTIILNQKKTKLAVTFKPVIWE